MKRIWVILLLLSPFAYRLSSKAYAQVDRDFWFAAPFLVNDHDESMMLGRGKICITSFADTAHICITQPAVSSPNDPFYFAPKKQTLPPYTSCDFDIGSGNGNISRANRTTTVPYGIHIESDAQVSAYYAQVNDNSELYTMKGRNALGCDFLVPMQRKHGNGFSSYSTIEIVATESNTQLLITTQVPTYQFAEPGTHPVTLHAGEVYTLQSVDNTAANHLGGTLIHSNKKVAVNSTDDSVADYGQDLVGEQIVPTDLAGNAYIAMRHRGNAEELILYTLPDAPIRYRINGGAEQQLAASSAVTIDLKTTYLSDSVFYIEADTAFVAFQLTSYGAELGGTVLPQLDCTGSREIVVQRRFDHQQLNMLVKTENTNAFSINGSVVTLPFVPVPAAPEWSYCYLDGTDYFNANGVLHVSNSEAIFHLAIMDYGAGGTCSYGYFSGYNQVDILPVASSKVVSTGDTLHLSVENEQLFNNLYWIYPDGTLHMGASQSVRIDSLGQAGFYRVKGVSKDGCSLTQDDYEVLVQVVQPTRHDSFVCISPAYPKDTMYLTDTIHLGCDILNCGLCIYNMGCTSSVYIIYRMQAAVEKGERYVFSIDYASTTNAHPTLQVLMNDSVIGTVIPSLMRSTLKTKEIEFTSPVTGLAHFTLQAYGSNNPYISVCHPYLKPYLHTRDTLYMHAIACDIPCPTPIVKDSNNVVRCDTLGAYTWRSRVIGQPGIYRDTVRSRGCDSLYYILNFDTVHCERPLCLDIITQRWNDVLGVMNNDYNGGYTFVHYSWYLNDQLLADENKSYIYVPATFREGDCYRAEMTDTNGKQWKTCPYCPEHIDYTNEGLTPVATKVIEENHLIIIRNGHWYNANGNIIK